MPRAIGIPSFLEEPYGEICNGHGYEIGSDEFYECIFNLHSNQLRGIREELYDCGVETPGLVVGQPHGMEMSEQWNYDMRYDRLCRYMGFRESHVARYECQNHFENLYKANKMLALQQCKMSKGRKAYFLIVRFEEAWGWEPVLLFRSFEACQTKLGRINRTSLEARCIVRKSQSDS